MNSNLISKIEMKKSFTWCLTTVPPLQYRKNVAYTWIFRGKDYENLMPGNYLTKNFVNLYKGKIL